MAKKYNKAPRLSDAEAKLWEAYVVDNSLYERIADKPKQDIEEMRDRVVNLSDVSELAINLIDRTVTPLLDHIKEIHLLRYIIRKELNISDEKLEEYTEGFNEEMDKKLKEVKEFQERILKEQDEFFRKEGKVLGE